MHARDIRSGATDGFTAVELMIVMVVMALMAAMAVPVYQGMVVGAKVKAAVSDIESISNAIDMHIAQTGTVPHSLADIGYDDAIDPWGNQYVFLNLQEDGDDDPVVAGGSGGKPLPKGLGNGKGKGKKHAYGVRGRGAQVAAAGETISGQRLQPNLGGINGDYDFYSMGPDQQSLPQLAENVSLDDIIRAQNGLFIGTAADFLTDI
ncbi:MAG: prepilin-type N-terminal cleavage/methylation domain-containing protein [Planctomycetota bacterium]